MTVDVEQILSDRQRAYLRTFKMTEGAGAAVLADLAVFCRADESCVIAPDINSPVDIQRTLVAEGRREVWLRIRAHLDLTDEQLVERFTRPAKGAISHDDPRDPHQ